MQFTYAQMQSYAMLYLRFWFKEGRMQIYWPVAKITNEN